MRPAAVLIASLVTIACSTGSSAGDSARATQAGAPSAADKAGIQRSIDSSLAIFVAAMNRGDGAGMASIFAEDAIVLAPGAPRASGRTAIIESNNGMFSAVTISGASIRTTDLIVSGDYAMETGVYEMTTTPKNTKGARGVKDVGKYVSVWRREPDGSWKIIRDIFNSDGAH